MENLVKIFYIWFIGIISINFVSLSDIEIITKIVGEITLTSIAVFTFIWKMKKESKNVKPE